MLRTFEKFDSIILEVYGHQHNDNKQNRKIAEKYAMLTGDRFITEDNSFFFRETTWQDQFRVYFNAPDETVENLRKLSIHVIDHKTPQSFAKSRYNQDCKYYFSNMYWFWQLVKYGYRLGQNKSISYEWATMKYHLQNFKLPELYHICKKETENPITEAQMLKVA
jgi:hypothetical protein